MLAVSRAASIVTEVTAQFAGFPQTQSNTETAVKLNTHQSAQAKSIKATLT
jgi:hypothetical protein